LYDRCPTLPFQPCIRARSGRSLILSPTGHHGGSPQTDRQLVFVLTSDGPQETLTPAEFARKYGWKNDPERARLDMERAGLTCPGRGR
jgi:hypothetical protein